MDRTPIENAHQRFPVYEHDLFRGTAEHYARYRPRYPNVLVEAILDALDLTADDRLLDLACGTGEISFALRHAFQAVWAIDLEPDMVAIGRRRAAELAADDITWSIGRAEDVDCPDGSFGVVATGRAFHRLDRPLIAAKALRWLRPGGYFVDLGADSSGLVRDSEPWLAIASDVYERWAERAERPRWRTMSQADPAQPRATVQAILGEAGYHNIDKREFAVPHTWSLDEFVGYLSSTSYGSAAFWGPAREGFERDLRAALLAYDPGGTYRETISAYFVVAQAPEDHR